MADVKRGVTTGFDDFFFPYRDDINSAGIECRFLLPGAKSMKGFDGIRYKEEDIDRWFLDVHDYVLDVSEKDDDKPTMESVEDSVKHSLEEDGYTGLLSWIRNAERNNEHLRRSLRNRPVWFDCGEAPQPEIMLQKISRKRYLTSYNSAGAVPSNTIDCIDPHSDINSKAIFGVLNSSFVHAIMEIWGRHEGKVLQLMTGDTKSLPLPDLRSITAEQTEAIVNVVDQIIDQDQAEIPEPLRDELDEVVLETVSEDISVSRIQEIQRDLHDRRVESDEKSTGTNAN
jgi:hypothetical protein